jgi:hypothetical protein
LDPLVDKMKERIGILDRNTMVKAYMQFWARIETIVTAVGNVIEQVCD